MKQTTKEMKKQKMEESCCGGECSMEQKKTQQNESSCCGGSCCG